MTAPENLPREKGSAEATVCLTCGEPLTPVGEPAADGTATFEPHQHDAAPEQASQELPREQGTTVTGPPPPPPGLESPSAGAPVGGEV